jgi:hypothetical protein
MEEIQIKALIEIYKNGITLKNFQNIVMAVFSGNTKIKCFTIKEFYIYCLKHPRFKNISENQLEIVLNYLSKYHIEKIRYENPKEKYFTEIYPNMINLEKEEDVLIIIDLYDNSLKL